MLCEMHQWYHPVLSWTTSEPFAANVAFMVPIEGLVDWLLPRRRIHGVFAVCVWSLISEQFRIAAKVDQGA